MFYTVLYRFLEFISSQKLSSDDTTDSRKEFFFCFLDDLLFFLYFEDTTCGFTLSWARSSSTSLASFGPSAGLVAVLNVLSRLL